MANQHYRPGTRQEKNNIVTKVRKNFYGGMKNDLDPSKLGSNSMYHLENIVGHNDSLRTRLGSELFAFRPLPYDAKIRITKTGKIATVVGDPIPETYIGKFVHMPDTRTTWTITDVPQGGATFSLSDSTVVLAERDVYVRSKQNADYYDEFNNRWYKLLGSKLYVSEVSDNPAYTGGGVEPRFLMSEWHVIARSGSQEPFDVTSYFHFSRNDLFMINSNGLFRLFISEKIDQMCYWKVNEVAPNIESVPDDVERTGIWDYGRRYIVTNSRFRGGNLFGDRSNGVGTFIELETPPPDVTGSSRKDWTTVYTPSPSGVTKLIESAPIDISFTSAEKWKLEGKQTFTIRIRSLITGEKKEAAVFVDYSNVTNFTDIIRFTQSGLNAAFGSDIGITVREEVDTFVWVMFSLNAMYRVDSIIQTPDEKIPTGTVDEVEDVKLYKSTIYTFFGLTPRERKVITNRGHVLDGLTILDEDGDRRSEVFSHYSIYATLEISSAEDVTGQLSVFRTVNNTDYYIWLADVPMIKPFYGKITEYVPGLEETRASTVRLVVDPQYIDGKDIGCIAHSKEGISIKIDDFGRIDLGNGSYRYYYDVTVLDGSIHIPIYENKAIGFCIGNEKEDVFSSSFDVAGKLTTTHVFSSIDIGKFVYLSDGSTLIIKNVIGTEAYITDIIGNRGREILVCGINPTSRCFNDTIDDFKLQSMMRERPLRKRFCKRIPDTSIGVFMPGYYFAADRGFDNLYYCETFRTHLIGYYKPVTQEDSSINHKIQSLSDVAGTLSIKCDRATYMMDPRRAYEAGDPRYNESFFSIPTPEMINEGIGCSAMSHVVKIDDNNELVFTSEPAIRFFGDDGYSDNIALDKVQEAYIKRFYPKIVIDYVADLKAIVITGSKKRVE